MKKILLLCLTLLSVTAYAKKIETAPVKCSVLTDTGERKTCYLDERLEYRDCFIKKTDTIIIHFSYDLPSRSTIKQLKSKGYEFKNHPTIKKAFLNPVFISKSIINTEKTENIGKGYHLHIDPTNRGEVCQVVEHIKD